MFHKISRWCGSCQNFREQGGGRLASCSAVQPRMVQGEHSCHLWWNISKCLDGQTDGHQTAPRSRLLLVPAQPSGSTWHRWHSFALSPDHPAASLSRFPLQLGTRPGAPAWLGVFREEKSCCESCWKSQEAHPAPARGAAGAVTQHPRPQGLQRALPLGQDGSPGPAPPAPAHQPVLVG